MGKAGWDVGRFNAGIHVSDGDYLEVKDHDSLDLTTAMTLSMWIKAVQTDHDHAEMGIEKESGWGAGEYALLPRFDNGKGNGVLLQMADLPEACDDETIGPNVLDNEWHFIAGTWDGETIKIYVDGNLETQLQCPGKLQKGDGALYIASRGGKERWLDGVIDEIKIYSRALKPKEILRDMKNPSLNQSVSPHNRLATFWGMLKADRLTP